MPVNKVSFEEIPSLRFQRSVVTALPEWNESLNLLQKPLKPREIYEIAFDKSEIDRMPIKDLSATFLAKLRRYIKDNPSKIKAELSTRGSAKHGTLRIFILGKDETSS